MYIGTRDSIMIVSFVLVPLRVDLQRATCVTMAIVFDSYVAPGFKVCI